MLGRLIRRIWYLLNRRRLELELEREMAAHRAEMGEPHRFGGTLRLREQSADMWGWAWLDDLWHDLRYGLRQLRRAPGFALVAILTLAVGIGANTTAFGILNAQLLAELPVPDPKALRQLEWSGRREFSEAAFRYVHEDVSGFSALSCVTSTAVTTLEHGARYEEARAIWVSGDFFRTLGFTTAIGRPLTPADDRADAPPVAVIDRYPNRALGRASDVIRLVIRQTLVPVLIGLLLGLACSPLVARVMEAARVINAVGWGELLAISAAISMVMLTAFAAASTTVWRVSRIEPATALREE